MSTLSRPATNKQRPHGPGGSPVRVPKANPELGGGSLPSCSFSAKEMRCRKQFTQNSKLGDAKNPSLELQIIRNSSAAFLLPPYTRVASGCGLSRRDCVSQMPKGKVEVGAIRASPGKHLGSLHNFALCCWWHGQGGAIVGGNPDESQPSSHPLDVDEVFSPTSVPSVASVKCQRAA